MREIEIENDSCGRISLYHKFLTRILESEQEWLSVVAKELDDKAAAFAPTKKEYSEDRYVLTLNSVCLIYILTLLNYNIPSSLYAKGMSTKPSEAKEPGQYSTVGYSYDDEDDDDDSDSDDDDEDDDSDEEDDAKEVQQKAVSSAGALPTSASGSVVTAKEKPKVMMYANF